MNATCDKKYSVLNARANEHTQTIDSSKVWSGWVTYEKYLIFPMRAIFELLKMQK